MKRLFSAALAALSTFAFGATLNPVSLLNPVGSTAGQAILSTGPSSAPAWGTISLSTLTGIVPVTNGGTGSATASGARTNLGLGSAATVNTGTSGATVPILNGANTWAAAQTFSVRPAFNGATPWDSANLSSPASTAGNLSQFASTTSAQLAATLSDETGTGASVFAMQPTITAPNIIGTISAGNAAAGSVGEYVSSSFSSVAMTSNTAANLTSIMLTPGDWDVSGFVGYTAANTTAVTAVIGGTSLTSAILPAIGMYNQQTASWPTNGAVIGVPTPIRRVNVSASTTVYMVGLALFSTSTLNATGFIQARRVR